MTRYTLLHDGLEREYFVFLPANHGDGDDLPVLLFMHGYGGSATGTEAEVTNGITRYAEAFGYARPESLDQDIRVVDQPVQRFQAKWVFQMQGNGLFSAAGNVLRRRNAKTGGF